MRYTDTVDCTRPRETVSPVMTVGPSIVSDHRLVCVSGTRVDGKQVCTLSSVRRLALCTVLSRALAQHSGEVCVELVSFLPRCLLEFTPKPCKPGVFCVEKCLQTFLVLGVG